MALELNLTFQRSLDRTSILVTDLTGSGATGYGGANPAVGDFSNFNITVTPADSVTLQPTGTPVVIPAYPTLPSAVSGTFTITSLLLLGVADTVIPDGVYLFEVSGDYSGGAGDGTATGSFYGVYYEIVECCIQSMIQDAVGCGCSGDSVKIQKLNLAALMLFNLRPVVFNDVVGDSYVVENELWNDAAEMLVSLKEICDNENCAGCGGC